METLLKTKRVLKSKLTHVQAAVDGSVELTAMDAKVYLERVVQLGDEFGKLMLEISQQCDDQHYDAYDLEFANLDSKVHSLKVRLANIDVPQVTHVRTPNVNSAEVRLPRIELPSFAGSYDQWLSFHDLFVASIHNNGALSGAQKLQYLKAAVKGEASLLIQSIPITDINYVEAWDILVQRYQNIREIVSTHLEKLIAQSSVGHSSGALRKLVDTTNECVRAIRVHGVPVDQWDVMLVHIITKLLDNNSRREWELTLDKNELPSFPKLMKFLDLRAHALAAASVTTKAIAPSKGQNRIASVHHGAIIGDCLHCGEQHELHKCLGFGKLTVNERQSVIKGRRLCFNCLRGGHQSKHCKSGKCRTCNGSHHTLLHFEKTAVAAPSDGKEQTTLTTHHFTRPRIATQVLLSTALVNVLGANGECSRFRALLDSASQASFVTTDCVQRLGLRRSKSMISFSGVSGGNTTSHGIVSLKLFSILDPEISFVIEALVLPKITSLQPGTPVAVGSWSHLKTLPLADPQFREPGTIDILLGADIYGELLQGGICKGSVGSPIAVETTLGWILMGKLTTPSRKGSVTSHHVLCNVDTTFNQFWDIEQDITTRTVTLEEQLCEEHFKLTHTRDSTGRFTVQLPFRDKPADLGWSRDNAVRRLRQVERRLSSMPAQQQEYAAFMREYEELGHLEPVPLREESPPVHQVYYLPHHAVYKASSTTTKTRVVFDASAKSSTGISLNDNLMVGPTIQDDIFALLLRFRKHTIALTADITKMYRQIRMYLPHTDFLRIVWRQDPSHPIRDYRLLTVTYGTSSAPFQATRCLQQLAEDGRHNWPLASASLLEDFYVDDLISGADSEPAALELQSELVQLLSSGGFQLCKWSSNSARVLGAVPPESRETTIPLRICDDQGVRALGIHWHPGSDNFSFMIPEAMNYNLVTKRALLSELAKLYDPLGWLSPATVQAKLLFQSLWQLNLGWDEPVPEVHQDQWMKYCADLPNIEKIVIPRCVTTPNSSGELHAFCGASERAYAAVVYWRASSLDGCIKVSLVASKTKVAPLKKQTLPRLELCGALLLSRLLKQILAALNLASVTIHTYTDSTVVLAWITSPPARWKTFVANRVSEIQSTIPQAHWHHVNTLVNPADCASRGISPRVLLSHKLWWNGPSFLQESSIPTGGGDLDYDSDLMRSEQKKTVTAFHITQDHSLMTKYSSLSKLQRITAWCRRFIYNAAAQVQDRNRGSLTVTELDNALLYWIKIVQENQFHSDLQHLRSGKPLSCKSQLLCLNPFVDSVGMLRVGGRLSKSGLSEAAKHPLVLPSAHLLTKLIISQEHINTLHGGPQLVLTTLQSRFWILKGRTAVRGVTKRCVVCHRHRVSLAHQLMGDLPTSRVNPTRPFTHCGVDYGGPFLLRVIKGRGNKRFKAYLALFVCFATRAVHLEAVSDLSTQAFLAALKRFVARRGKPSTIRSDCGTNFVGANAELRDFLQLIRGVDHNQSVSTQLSNQGIDWLFNPPSSPHFGGLWEAGIKSTKYHLKRIVGNATLTFEEFHTVLAQIEAVLNSRPLSALSSDPNDLGALTPGHFLIGGPLNAIPEPDLTLHKVNRLSRWQYSQRLVQHFWRRWSSEYLTRLQQRPKWWTRKHNLQINDLVLIKDELPPLKWKMGRFTQLHPGKDGLIRTVTLTTSNGLLK